MENRRFIVRAAENASESRLLDELIQQSEEFYKGLSGLTELVTTVDKLTDWSFASLKPYLREFLDGESVRQIVTHELRQSSKSLLYRPRVSNFDGQHQQGFVAVSHEKFRVLVSTIDASYIKNTGQAPRSIQMHPTDTLVKFVKADGAVISRYECEPITDDSLPTNDLVCWKTEEIEVSDGFVLELRAGVETFVLEKCNSTICAYQAAVENPDTDVIASFDADSCRLTSLCSASDRASRVQMLSSTLAALSQRNAVDSLLPLVDSPAYFVRWHVIREILSLDKTAGREVLERAKSDSHAQVRQAALETASMIAALEDASS